MKELLYADITYQIRGACFWVWKELGSAFKESAVDKALTLELKKRGLAVESQKRIDIFYNKIKVGSYVPDIIVNDKVIVELKRKPFLTKQDHEQFWHYLRGSPYRLGLLINFGDPKLEIKRIIYDTKRINR
jgi:GxxExxY protein